MIESIFQSLLQKKNPLSQSFQLERSQNLLMYHHIYAILVHAVCVDRNQWMAPRLVPLLEVPEGPDDPSMPQILAMKFTFLRCQPQWELTIPPINQAKPIGKHLGFQFPFIFKCPFLKFEFQNLSFVTDIRLTHTLPTSIFSL